MANLFNDPAIDSIVRYSAGGSTPPTWMDVFNKHKASTNNFNGKGVNAWNQDETHRATKARFDQEYLSNLAAYNKANGTNIQPDKAVLGADVNPNEWHDPSKNVDQRGGFLGKQLDNIQGFLADPSKSLTNLGADISKSPLAQTIITIAATAYGVPPNVTKAFLAANDIGQGADPAQIAKNLAIQYVAGKATGMAKDAIGTTGNKIADSAINRGVSSGVNAGLRGGNVLEAALRGGVSGAVGGGQDYLLKSADAALKGTDEYQALLAAAKEYKVPGVFDAVGQVLPNVKASDVRAVLAGTPAGKQILAAERTLKNPGQAILGDATRNFGNKVVNSLVGSSAPATAAPAGTSTGSPMDMSLLALAAMTPREQEEEKPEYKTAQIEQPDVLKFLNANTPGDSYADLINLTRSA